jgi:N-formylglutamate amidohydrolase
VRSLPIIANLPHSGLKIPEAIASHFTPEHLRSLPNSDWHLQQLYAFLPSLGVTVMQANYSRYVVDLNRALKPPFFGSFWSAVVPEQTAFKQPIYRAQKPSKTEVIERIDEFYTPYHQQLAEIRYPLYLCDEQLKIHNLSSETPTGVPQWQSPMFEQAQHRLKTVFETLLASRLFL